VRCPTIIGRSTEVIALQAAVAAARLGRGGAVALVGPPGIGKSRLARETVATAQA
jgi:predicted ATPase